MIFKSSEIRWFSSNKELLWDLYTSLPEAGEGTRESDRTDYYLKSGTINTGIKIREGNHELKVKCAEDEELDCGVMEHWIKWSTSEERNILNTVDEKMLGDWVAVKKKRFKKSYEIVDQDTLRPLQEEFVNEGCGAEFTEIHLQELDQPLYTFGFEAFSAGNKQRENLQTALNILDADLSQLKELESYGYPKLLEGLSRGTE